MSPIEIVYTKSTQPARDEVVAENSDSNPDTEKGFSELMDRTLARTGQKPPARETQAARKPVKKSQSQAVAKTADDDSDSDAAPDDKKTVSAAQAKTDPSTIPTALVTPLQIFPIAVELAKLASAQAAAGAAKTPAADGAGSGGVSPPVRRASPGNRIPNPNTGRGRPVYPPARTPALRACA